MRLAQAITNSAGVTLMPADIRLTPMFILRLKKWNVETVEVYSERPRHTTRISAPAAGAPAGAASAATAPNMTAEQEQFARAIATEVSRWFVNVRDNPLMMMLRLSAIKRLVAHGPHGLLNLMRHPEGFHFKAEEPR